MAWVQVPGSTFTYLSNAELFNIIDSISSFRTFLEELIIPGFVWLDEKFLWIENNAYNYFAYLSTEKLEENKQINHN